MEILRRRFQAGFIWKTGRNALIFLQDFAEAEVSEKRQQVLP